MKDKLTFLGHGSVKLTTGSGIVVYIDPAFPGAVYDEEADLILVTHHHGDHDKTELVKQKPDCAVWDNRAMLINGEYQTKEIKGLRIMAVPAYNKNHKKEDCVGYVIFSGDKSIYLAGDTSKIAEMAQLAAYDLDYALMPVDGYYNMGPKEAEECAELIKVKCFIPIHNDPRSMEDGREYTTNFDRLKSKRVRILQHGESLEI